MIKYAKITNQETKQCEVGIGTNTAFYESIGMTQMDVEQAYTGDWYMAGYAPQEPAPTEEETKQARIAELQSQLASTDYKIIKCSECQLAGEDLPYDIVELHTARQALRDEINELQGE